MRSHLPQIPKQALAERKRPKFDMWFEETGVVVFCCVRLYYHCHFYWTKEEEEIGVVVVMGSSCSIGLRRFIMVSSIVCALVLAI